LYKLFIQKFITIIFGSLLLLNTVPVSTAYAAARDCDGNALVYCGTTTKSELRSKLTNGTGKQYQSSAELKALFGKWGFDMADIDKLQEGKVNNKNQAFVGNTIVAYNVYTYGRHDIAGSTRVADISYPIYKRHPAVSFLSSSIDAYVYVNYDGSMAYAILKSCGNIVQGVGKRTAPVPPPTPATPTPDKVSVIIQKFEDLNSNGIQDGEEKFLSGWNFRVSGAGVLRSVTTDANGQVTVTDLDQGIYVVTEVGQTGWTSTTGLTKSHLVTIDPNTQTFQFGNVKIINTVSGGGEILLLPSTGLAEDIAIIIAIVVAFALLAYFGTRAYLRKSLSGEAPPTDPRKLIKELRRRTKEKAKKKG
jgi:hypothetical protein